LGKGLKSLDAKKEKAKAKVAAWSFEAEIGLISGKA
jgi:hypothetical protein